MLKCFFDFEGTVGVGDSVGGDMDLVTRGGPFLKEAWAVEEEGYGWWVGFVGKGVGEETA